MYFDEFEVGFCVKTKPVFMEKEKMIAFAKQYDRIPLHTDEEFAKTTIFKDLIASGFYTALVIYGEFTENHVWKDGHIAGNMTKFEFPKPVFAGDTLTGIFTVTKKTPIDETRGVIEETMEVFNQKNELVLRGTSNKFLKMKPKAAPQDITK